MSPSPLTFPPTPTSRAAVGRLPWLAAAVAWLLVSAVFLTPHWNDASGAIRGDDYWAMSEWFGTGGPYPHTHFGPGYPALIHALRSVGVGLFGVLVLNKLMVAITGLAIFHLGRSLGVAPRTALLAGAGFTVFPVVQANSSLIFAETFYLMLSAVGVAILFARIRRHRPPTTGWLVAGYGLLALAALVRGNALVLLAACAVIGVFTLPWRALAVALAIASLPVLGWSSLNWHWYGHFKPTSSGDATLAANIVGPVMTAQAGRPRVPGPEAWIDGPWQDRYPNLFELAIDTRRMAVAYAKEHPVPVLIGNVRGWFKGLVGPAQTDLAQLLGRAGILLTGISLAVRGALLLGLIGFVIAGGIRRQPAFSAFLAAMLAAHLLAPGAAGYSRFGFPIDAFSVLALALFWQWRHHDLATIRSPGPSTA